LPIEPYLTQEMLDRLVRLPKLQRKIALVKIAEEEWNRCAEDITYWLDAKRHPIPYVYTKDPKAMHRCNLCPETADVLNFDKRQIHLLSTHKIQANSGEDVKQYFTELDTIREWPMMDYMRPIIDVWQKEKLLVVEKSRDMMATWLMVAMYSWDSFFHKGRQNIFQSENATKTRDLVDRAYTLYSNQPEWLKNVHPATSAEGGNRAGIIKVPSLQSEIIGFPAGADKIRQYHPSGVFSDEAAFNPNASESFAAIKPAISGGGRYSAISSANPGWFQRICRDTLEQ
jgi:hypothetical protein